MTLKVVLAGFIVVFFRFAVAQEVTNTEAIDSLESTVKGRVSIGGYVDSYFGYNFSKPSSGTNPYFVSSARHNELTINLAYVDVRYKSKYLRARFVPGFGTYMDANYANEPGSLKNMVEASVGVVISEKAGIWIDAGVLNSPYTNETAVSKDHLMYTRAFAPENAPYYITGAKLTIPIHSKVTAYLYLINGWQVIQDNNSGKSIGTQVEYRPNKSHWINWSTYSGEERSFQNPDFRLRYFNDFHWIYNAGRKFSASSGFYFGHQQRDGVPSVSWWQINFTGSYAFTKVFSFSARLEHFNDEGALIVKSITGLPGFRSSSAGAGLSIKLHRHALLRFEGRRFFSDQNVYLDEHNNPANGSTLLIGNLTAWF